MFPRRIRPQKHITIQEGSKGKPFCSNPAVSAPAAHKEHRSIHCHGFFTVFDEIVDAIGTSGSSKKVVNLETVL